MNKTNTSEWEHYLMQFRLRSSRSRKRMMHEDLEKTLLQLNRERKELYQQQRNLGWMELNPPVMRGWKRYFVLREDIARSKHAALFQNILNKINTIEISDKKSFTVKKRKWGRKIQVEQQQKLLEPNQWHFQKLKFSEREIQFFYEVIVKDQGNKWYKKYVFVEPWRFVLRIRPNLITKTRVRDEAIEKRIKEINQFLDQRAWDAKLYKLLNGSTWHWWKRDEPEKYRFKQKPLSKLMDEADADHFSLDFADE